MPNAGKQTAAEVAMVAVLYATLAYLGALLAVPPGNVTAVSPPSGLGLAALLLRGAGLWPGIFLGALFGNFLSMDVAGDATTPAFAASACIGVGSALQALVGYAVLSRWTSGRDFIDSPRGIAIFGGIEPLVCIISPTVGVVAMVLAGLVHFESVGSTWLTFWLGDLGGVYLVVPLLLAPASQRSAARRVETVGLIAVALALSQLSFDRPLALGWHFHGPILFMFYPVTVWAGYRMGPRGAAWMTLLCFGLALWGTATGTGPLVHFDRDPLPVLNLFLGGLSLPALTLAAAAEERYSFGKALQEQQSTLEHRVEERTLELRQANRALEQHIAERERAERDLARTRAWLDVAFQNVPFEVFVCDRDGHFSYQNTASVRRWGHQLGQDVAEVELPNTLDGEWPDLQQRALAGEFVSKTQEYGAEGDTHVVDTVLAPVVSRGQVEGFVGMTFDVTERHRMLQELRNAQRMETVARLAGGIAHDFNNLLTAIVGHVTILHRDPGLDHETYEVLETIELAAERAADLTAQLLALSGQRPGMPESVRVDRVLEEVLTLSRPILGEGVATSLRAEKTLWPVRMDSGTLDQVLMNLVVNARDAMGEVGQVDIAADNLFAEASPLQMDTVRITVKDTGPGMSREIQARVFEPFFTTKAKDKGTGLGLSVCYGLTRRAGGAIHVESEPGRGTTFTVLLPRDLAPELSPRRNVPQELTPAPVVRNKTVLFVEDEEIVRRLGVQVLSHAGYTVLAASDGEHALDVAADRVEQIDLVVADMVMPKLGGRDLIARLRQLRPELPALLSSGHSEDLFGPGGGPNGDGFLAKPYRPSELLNRVQQAIEASG